LGTATTSRLATASTIRSYCRPSRHSGHCAELSISVYQSWELKLYGPSQEQFGTAGQVTVSGQAWKWVNRPVPPERVPTPDKVWRSSTTCLVIAVPLALSAILPAAHIAASAPSAAGAGNLPQGMQTDAAYANSFVPTRQQAANRRSVGAG
jgi:hypothetical protein